MNKKRNFSLDNETIEVLDRRLKKLKINHSVLFCLLIVRNERTYRKF